MANKIISVEAKTSWFITTEDGTEYERGGSENGGWWEWMGNSLEECYWNEKELESDFQEFRAKQIRDEK